MISVFLVAPLTVFRGALSTALGTLPDMRIDGESASTADTLRAIRTRSTTKKILVVVTLDAGEAREELLFVRRLKQEFPMVTVLATAPTADTDIISQALDSGVDSFVPQDRDLSELIESIRRTAAGETVVATSKRRPTRGRQSPSNGARGALLTNRELQVLRLVGAGLTARQIARELSLQERTVTTHLQHIYRKLRVSNRVAALMAASRAGILDPSPVGDDALGRWPGEA
jgi:DNA-binding NarL/FixJ family response regulator